MSGFFSWPRPRHWNSRVNEERGMPINGLCNGQPVLALKYFWIWQYDKFLKEKRQKYLEGIVHIPAEPWDGDDKSAEGEPEDKNWIVHMLRLVEETQCKICKIISVELRSTCLVIMLMVAERMGTAKAQRIPVKSCSGGWLFVKWNPLRSAINALIGTWKGQNSFRKFCT